MKDKIEEKLYHIYIVHRINEKTKEDASLYVFTGDNGEYANDATVKVLGDYFEQLEKQKELVLDVLQKKAREKSITYEEGMKIIGILDRAVKNLEKHEWK